ncbi:MAG: hypothetical protein ABSF50_07790 [Burkholderiaceae bacterium]
MALVMDWVPAQTEGALKLASVLSGANRVTLSRRTEFRILSALVVSVALHAVGAALISGGVLFGNHPQANARFEARLTGPAKNSRAIEGMAAVSEVGKKAPAPSTGATDPDATRPDLAHPGAALHSGELTSQGESAAIERDLPARDRIAHRRELVSPFLPPEQVDRAAYPLGSPNLAALQFVTAYSGLPVRLRLFIGAKGDVVDVKTLRFVPGDEEVATLLVQVWSRVTFVPARREGKDVPSYIDVEFHLSDQDGDPIVR